MDKPNNNNNETVESTSNQPPRADSTGDDGSSFFAGSLPADVVKRVNALRNLQVEHHKIEANFFEEVHALECRFLDKYQDLYSKRSTIIKGTYEPTEAEAKCEFDGDDEPKNDEPAEKTVGIPEFWLQVFKNSDIISDLIKEHDEDVLKHLIDVRITMQNEEKKYKPTRFSTSFRHQLVEKNRTNESETMDFCCSSTRRSRCRARRERGDESLGS